MTPIERAARALCENPSENPDELIEMFDGKRLPRWRAEVWRVEAVLQAIREPSEAMIGQAQTAIDQCLEQGEPTILADACWQAMVGAALEEG